MFRILLSFLLLATTFSVSSLAQTYELRCVNGKCAWYAVAPSTATVEAARVRSSFKQALLQAAEQEYKASIAASAEGQAARFSRLDMLKVRVFCLNPKRLAQLEQAVSDQLVLDQQVPSINAIDWDKLIGIIKDMLPIILEIIKLISSE